MTFFVLLKSSIAYAPLHGCEACPDQFGAIAEMVSRMPLFLGTEEQARALVSGAAAGTREDCGRGERGLFDEVER